jgi:hypothetical protein
MESEEEPVCMYTQDTHTRHISSRSHARYCNSWRSCRMGERAHVAHWRRPHSTVGSIHYWSLERLSFYPTTSMPNIHRHCGSESVCRYTIRTIMFYVDLCNDYAIWRATLCVCVRERERRTSCLVALVSRCSAGKHANRPSTHPTHTERKRKKRPSKK